MIQLEIEELQMYENQIIVEPKWKSWIVKTTTPLFTPAQCREIIEAGRKQKPQKIKKLTVMMQY